MSTHLREPSANARQRRGLIGSGTTRASQDAAFGFAQRGGTLGWKVLHLAAPAMHTGIAEWLFMRHLLNMRDGYK
jgi:hypothetical protein